MTTKFALLSLVATAMLVSVADCAVAQQRAAAIIPHASWDAGMPDGIPAPEAGSLIFEATVPLERVADIGLTQYGERRVAVGLEGSVTGPKLTATVAEGALDYELELANGTIEIEQILVLRAADGSYILVRNAGTGPNAADVRVVLDFEAPSDGAHAWLNDGKFVARRELDAAAKTLRLRAYDVSAVTVDRAGAVTIEKPANVPSQSWDYRRKGDDEAQGEMLIRENVTLGPSQRVGASKRGPRNIIPITGGELSGKINGKVLMGGADYQNLTPPAEIDARYLWETADGEVILVRNAGPFGALVPTFEARVDGPYAYLNSGKYLSSNPGMGQGGVSITFYESTK